MTLLFAACAALMAALALAFVLWPLLRRTHQKTPVALAIGLAFVLPVSALAMYLWVGTPAALTADLTAPDSSRQLNLSEAVAQLQMRLQQNPDDLEGWTLLARAHQALGQPDDANRAWDRAVQLAPNNPSILAAAAQARSTQRDDHRIDDIARKRLQKALEIDPDHQRALWLKGISDYQQGQFQDAARVWQHLLRLVNPQTNPEVANAIARQIERAHAAAGLPASSSSAAPIAQAAATTGATIQVQVRIAPDLARLAEPDSTVFVYARAVDGPPMPLAVQRLTVADLPASITLDDSMAMLPQRKLSSARQVSISARISASGNAQPQAGDLEARPVQVTMPVQKAVTLVIDHAR